MTKNSRFKDMQNPLSIIKVLSRIALYSFIIHATMFSLVFASELSGQYKSVKEVEVNVELEAFKIIDLFDLIEDQTAYRFSFERKDINSKVMIDLTPGRRTVADALLKVAEHSQLSFLQINDVINVKKRRKKKDDGDIPLKIHLADRVVQGKVVDEKGEPIPGVTVRTEMLTDPKTGDEYAVGSVTGIDGGFRIRIPEEAQTLVFSSIGFATREVEIGDQVNFDITMIEDIQSLNEVVVTGYYMADKESFTGTASTVTNEQLIQMGGTNLLDNLVLVDPSVQIVQNNSLGSNPNAIPEIRIRGQSVFNTNDDLSATNLLGDPNQPLFILDNFQVDIQRVLDLDQTRVESVTILRDASATAIYGSRAANGVIVIKTFQPKSGELQVSYNGFTDVDIPDVDTYDLLSGQELFDMQKRLGMRSQFDLAGYETREIEKLLAAGVNTDWIAQPVEAAVGQRHSLNIQGGNEEIRYQVDFNYQNRPGVMKESGRENYGGAMTLIYNPSDVLTFQNRLEVNFNDAQESPYGSFDYYASMPSYLPLRNLNGSFTQFYEYPAFGGTTRFEDGSDNSIYNPLYEATVGNLGQSSYTNFINNFEIIWNINEMFRIQGNLSYTQQTDVSELFLSPFSAEFEGIQDIEDVGSFTYTTTDTRRIDGSSTFNFSKDFSGHFINANIGANIQENVAQRFGFEATGYTSTNPDPAFSAGYVEDGFPQSEEATSRLAGLFATANYTYNNRYLIDASYRLDGSSAFGADSRFAPFFSVGTGWNIHNEAFIPKNDMINSLRLRATYGETGSVAFSSYQALTTSQYYSNYRYVGSVGSFLRGIGNEELRWQTTENRELGLDFVLWNNRITGQAAVYQQITNDLVTDIDAPPSLGFDTFTENLGQMENRGFETSLRVDVVRSTKFRVNVFATALQNKSRILSIGDALSSFNDNANRAGLTPEQFEEALANDGVYTVYNEDGTATNSEVNLASLSQDFLILYEEGGSENDIWAVPSLGIDPMTGEEYFLMKEGEATTVWDPNDKVVVGNTEPTMRGTFGANIAYKGFNLGLTFGYEFGGQVYNQTLVDRIENSDKYGNVDRRVLTRGWFEPGDVVPFKSNVVVGATVQQLETFASSRFVQDFSFVELSALNLTYDAPREIVERWSLTSLRLSFNMNDIFYSSTVRLERGTAYPFARSFTLGLRAGF